MGEGAAERHRRWGAQVDVSGISCGSVNKDSAPLRRYSGSCFANKTPPGRSRVSLVLIHAVCMLSCFSTALGAVHEVPFVAAPYWGTTDLQLTWPPAGWTGSEGNGIIWILVGPEAGTPAQAALLSTTNVSSVTGLDLPLSWPAERLVHLRFEGWNSSAASAVISEAHLHTLQHVPGSKASWLRFELAHELVPCSHPSRLHNEPCAGGQPAMWLRVDTDVLFAGNDSSASTTLALAWEAGDPAPGSLPAPSSLPLHPLSGAASRLVQVSGGFKHACAVRRDWSVVCWGRATKGGLGTGDLGTYGNTPGTVHTHAGRSVPIGPVRAVSVGDLNTCVLKRDGRLACWGYGQFGVHGQNTTEDLGDDPGEIWPGMHVPIGNSIVAVEVGYFHTLAIRSDGSVVCWGHGGLGRCGYGNQDVVNVLEGNLDASLTIAIGGPAHAVAVGFGHSCVIRADLSTVCFGRSTDGQLGYGNPNSFGDLPSHNIVSAVVPVAPIVAIHIAYDFTCGLRLDGGIVCWGKNTFGSLGQGHENSLGDDPGEVHPGLMVPAGKDFVALATSHRSVCGVRSNGAMFCWGFGSFGKLGSQNEMVRGDERWEISRGRGSWWGGPVVGLAIGEDYTCALRSDGTIGCLGLGADGALATGESVERGSTATSTYLEAKRELVLSASQYVLQNRQHAEVVQLTCNRILSCCARTRLNRLICFGNTQNGQLGVETTVPIGTLPGQLHEDYRHPAGELLQVDMGAFHGCGITADTREILCWGYNLHTGCVGLPSYVEVIGAFRESMFQNVRRVDIGSGFVSVSAGMHFSCAVRGDAAGSTVCWGLNKYGQLGLGHTRTIGDNFGEISPNLVIPDVGPMASVAAGDDHACGVRRDGTAVCWGSAQSGRLGNGMSSGNIGGAPGELTNTTIIPIGPVAIVSVGVFHSCAVLVNSSIVCWGSDTSSTGRLGCRGCLHQGDESLPFPSLDSYIAPVGEAVAISVSLDTSCIARVDGSSLCWGSNANGQLGQPSAVFNLGHDSADLSGISIPIGGDAVSVAATDSFSCVLKSSGSPACFGRSHLGMGYGTTASVVDELVYPELKIDWTRRELRVVSSRFLHPSLMSMPADIDARLSPNLRAVPALAESPAHLIQDLTSLGVGPLNRFDSCPGQVLVKWGVNSVCSYDPSLPVWWQRTPTASIDGVAGVSTGMWGEHLVVQGLGARIRLRGQLHWVAMWGVPQVFTGNGSVPCSQVELPEWDQLECTVGAGVGANLSVTILSGPEAFVPVVRRGRLVSYAPPRLDTVVVDSRDNPITALVADPAGGQALRLIGRNFGVDVSQAAVIVGGVECPLISAGVFSFTDGEAFCRLPSRPALQGSEGWAAGLPFQAAVRVTVGGQEAAQDVGIEIGAPLFLQATPPAVQVGHASSNNTVNVTLQGRYLGHNASAVTSLFIAGQLCPGLVWGRPTPHVWSLTCVGLPVAGLNTSAPPIAVTAFGEAFTQLDALKIVPPPDMTPLRIISSGPGSTEHEQAITVRGTGIGAVASDVLHVEVSDWGACHSVSWVDSSEVSCMAPAGAGIAEPVRVFLAGGHVLQGSLQYAALAMRSIWPNTILPWKAHHPGGDVTMQLCTDGARWSPPGRLLTAADVAIQVAGSPCVFQAQLNATCLSCWVDTATVVPGAASSVRVRGAQAIFAPGVGVQVLSLPQVSAVVPPLVSAAGGQVVEILGIGFCRNTSSDVESVRIGSQAAAVRSCTSTSMSVSVPRPPDSAQTAGVNITLMSGHSAILQDALQFTRPEVLTVLGGLVQPAPQGSQQIRNVSVTGLALDDGPRSRAGLLFGSAPGISCAQAGGELIFTSTRSLECRGFRTAALAPLASGRMTDTTITIQTAQNLTAVSSLGTLRIMGPPQISELSSSSAAVNDTLTVTGSGFGLAQSDIAAVRIGARQVTTFTRGSESIVTMRVPEPASHELADVFTLDVAISLTSGHTAVLPRSFSYTLAPNAPVSAPTAMCPYRDEAGVARVAFNWTDDAATLLSPVGAWHVSFGEILHGGLISRVNASTRLVSLAGGAAGDILRNVVTPSACQGLREERSTLDFSVRIADAPAQPLWVAVAAVVLGESAGSVLRGPLSTEVGPLLPACAAAEYLATHELGEGRWPQVTCRPCPQGAVCNGAEWERVLAAPGWFRLPWREPDVSFEACLSEEVCPGESQSPIHVPSRHYISSAFQALPGLGVVALNTSAAGSDSNVFASHLQSSCEASRTGPLCAACAEGYTGQGDGSHPCARCAPTWLNWLGVVGGVTVAGVLVAALTRSALSSGGAQPEAHVALNKVLLTHLQQVGIAAAFPLAWPSELRGMFRVFDAASSVGNALISVDCLGLDSTSAFRGTQILTLLLPVVLGLGILIVWRFLVPLIWHADGSIALNCCCSCWCAESSPVSDVQALPSFNTPKLHGVRQSGRQSGRETHVSNPMRARSRASSVQRALRGPAASIQAQARTPPGQGMVVSLLVMCFVLHLGLTRSALSLFTCRMIGGRSFLVGDVQISCDDPSHRSWMYGIGVPGFVLYGCGITAACVSLLWVHRATLETPATSLG